MSSPAEDAANQAIGALATTLSDEIKLDALILVEAAAKQWVTFTTDEISFNFPEGVDVRASGVIMRLACAEGLVVPRIKDS